MKRLLNISLVLLLTMFIVTGCGKTNEKQKQGEIKANTNNEVVKNQKIGNFEFTNTSLVYQDGTSTFQTEVTNTGDETEYLSEFLIHVKDNSGNEIVTLTGFVGDSISPNQKKVITSSYGEDLTVASTITYEVVE